MNHPATRALVIATCGIVLLFLMLPIGTAVAASSRSGGGELMLWLLGLKIAQEQEPTRIDINSATFNELRAVPGVGRSDALQIIAQRPYAKLAELARAGMSPLTIQRLTQFLVVDSDSSSALPGPAGRPSLR